ncbi:MAG: glycosyltransferase family 4 protein [Legionellaceae bacterium]|nr:glycosyltransferase family 4 protein [Legionellaceae bacterium]
MKNKVIWYCHHYAGSPSLGMSYRPYYFTQAFNQAGHQAYVISASHHHLKQASEPQQEAIKKTMIENVPFVLLKTRAYRENGLSRLMNMLQYAFKFRTQKKNIMKLTGKPDVIIVSSAHPFHFKTLEKFAKKHDAILIFEVRDLWPLSLIQLAKLHPLHPLSQWIASIEKYAYKHADAVVSLLDKALPYMKAKGLDPARFYVIPNGTNPDLFCLPEKLPEAMVDCIQAVKQSGAFLVGYAGALGEPNALKYLISAMKLLADKQHNIHVFLLGEGALKADLEAYAAQENLANITFFNGISKHEVPGFLNQMDVLYLGWNAVDLYEYGVSPNKIFDYMMSETPIIESGGAPDSMIERLGCGLRCDAANPLAIMNAILQMQELSDEQRLAMGARGKQAVELKYDYQVLARDYLKLFNIQQ